MIVGDSKTVIGGAPELFGPLFEHAKQEGLVAGVGAVVTACQRVGIRSQVQRLSRPHRGDRRARRRRRGQRPPLTEPQNGETAAGENGEAAAGENGELAADVAETFADMSPLLNETADGDGEPFEEQPITVPEPHPAPVISPADDESESASL